MTTEREKQTDGDRGRMPTEGQPLVPARYVHTNLIARDWDRLVAFYREVFGCTPASPEGNYDGPWVADITAVADAQIRVIHLRLPGGGKRGPTLEIIRYDRQEPGQKTAPNRPGFGHIAFAVDDVRAARDAVIRAGGRPVGEVVSVELPGRGTVTEVYVADPEGNIIELQKWAT